MAMRIEPSFPAGGEHTIVKCQRKSLIPLCNSATRPGVITERSCAYYGARWMLAAIPDLIHIIHGPAGCAFYGGTVRRKGYRVFSSDMNESDIVFGSGDKLYHAILSASRRQPEARAVLVYGTCAAGITGEDLGEICSRAAKTIDKPVVPLMVPGFCGCSQAAGHDLAARVLLEHFIGSDQESGPLDNSVNILGEFDIRNDLSEIERLLNKIGLKINCAVSGRATTKTLARAHRSRLNIVHCRSTGELLALGMKERWKIPFIKVSFYGLNNTAAAIRSIAGAMGRPGAEETLREEIREVEQEAAVYRQRLSGKKAALFFGASRMGAMAGAFQELGMDLVMVGSQFGRSGDYQEAEPLVSEGTTLIDDACEHELEVFLHEQEPDLLVGGTKEKYMATKLGVPFLVFPQATSPFSGLRGFVNLAREVSALISAPVWRFA